MSPYRFKLIAVTQGLSPKVYIPAVGQILVGVAFLIFGLDVEGKTAIATGLGTFGVGYTAKPGTVVEKDPAA